MKRESVTPQYDEFQANDHRSLQLIFTSIAEPASWCIVRQLQRLENVSKDTVGAGLMNMLLSAPDHDLYKQVHACGYNG